MREVYCPVNAYDCPYCDKDFRCHIENPIEDCDDFASVWESWEEWEDAENEDENAPHDFSEDEIQWARDRFGYPN